MKHLDDSPRDEEKRMPKCLKFGLLNLSARFLSNNPSGSIALLTKDCSDFKIFE